jgi:hypothetical protein
MALAAGGPVLFLYEKLAAARDALGAVGAQPAAEAALRPAAGTPAGDDGPPPVVTFGPDGHARRRRAARALHR